MSTTFGRTARTPQGPGRIHHPPHSPAYFFDMDSNAFLWYSRSRPGQLHKTWREGGVWHCTCRAGRKGHCWHLSTLAKLADCGSKEAIERRHGVKANWI